MLLRNLESIHIDRHLQQARYSRVPLNCTRIIGAGGKCLEKSIILKTFSALQNSPSCDTIATWMQKEADGAYSVQFFNHEELAVFLNGQHTGTFSGQGAPGVG